MRQISKTQRRLAAGAFLIVAAPVALTSVAYACQSLSTLHANPRSAQAGASVTLFGKNYQAGLTNTQIEIHLDGRNGRLLTSFPQTSILNGTVVIPSDVSVGTHTLVATQYNAAGNAVSGSPGRASIVVTAAARSGGGTATAATSAEPVAATAATPAAASTASAPAAAATVSAPAASVAAPVVATAGTATAAAAIETAPGAATTAAAIPAAAATVAAAADQSAPAAGPASVNVGLLPASAESSGALPGITLAAGLALVLLGLGAFVKSGRNMLGRGTTLAG